MKKKLFMYIIIALFVFIMGLYTYTTIEDYLIRKVDMKPSTLTEILKKLSKNKLVTCQNDVITIFSNEIATAITQIIRNPDNRYKPKNFCYCYYHGVFIIYIWGDESTVRQLILEIEKSLYEIPEKHNLRVFVQPFFGIYQINDPKEDLFICCDNALMARNQSERYFENITF